LGTIESHSDSNLKEISEISGEEINLSAQIRRLYDCLQELGYLIRDLYDMDINELENTLINRRKGIANECYMIGVLARTALAQKIPSTPEEMYPSMFPPKKTYAMPDFLRERAIKDLKERGVNIAR